MMRPWNENYEAGDLPWDTGMAEPMLVEFVTSGGVKPGRTLEVGAGTGTNAIWLAEHGFDVLGTDVSPLAVERARAKAASVARCRFEVGDFLAAAPAGGPFDFVFDRGCFHVFDEPEDRARFAARVASVLAPEGLWLSIVGSTEGPPRDSGPPRRSARDLTNAIEPSLELVVVRTGSLASPRGAAPAWFCLSRQRDVPAQPSTQTA